MLNTEQCWASVTTRDAASDGTFVYAVRTSGVYCRPACPSRLPLRKNVDFYETTEAAEAAGFRACKRCRPSESSEAKRHVAAIGRACALIRERDTPPSLTELAAAAGISRFHFHRVFKQITGTTPREWGKARRIGRSPSCSTAARASPSRFMPPVSAPARGPMRRRRTGSA